MSTAIQQAEYVNHHVAITATLLEGLAQADLDLRSVAAPWALEARCALHNAKTAVLTARCSILAGAIEQSQSKA